MTYTGRFPDRKCSTCGGPCVGRGSKDRCAPCRSAERRCTACGGAGPFTRTRDVCVECVRARNILTHEKNGEAIRADHRRRYAADPEKYKALQYMNRYGLSREQVVQLFDAQGGQCAICDGEMVLGGRSPASACVDHDHRTGEIRGMLCAACNKGIGYLRDSERILLRAIDYLKPQPRLHLVKGGR